MAVLDALDKLPKVVPRRVLVKSAGGGAGIDAGGELMTRAVVAHACSRVLCVSAVGHHGRARHPSPSLCYNFVKEFTTCDKLEYNKDLRGKPRGRASATTRRSIGA